MRARAVLGVPVRDPHGVVVGTVCDLGLTAAGPARQSTGERGPVYELRVIDVIVGAVGLRGRLAAAWGFASRPDNGPALLRRLVSSTPARVVPVSDTGWGQDGLHIKRPLEDYPSVSSQEGR